MPDQQHSNFHSVRFIPATSQESAMKSEPISFPTRHAQHPNLLNCVVGASAYSALATFLYVIPTLSASQSTLQLCGVGIGALAICVNHALHSAILGKDASASQNVVQTLVLDTNRTNRLN